MKKVRLRIDELLGVRGRSAYWLARQLGMGDGNLYKYRKGQVKALNLELLARMCEILDCQPGELIELVGDGPETKRKPVKKASRQDGVTHGSSK
ncbi:MAG TPA: helix-turn-helix transcriptional regulator [Blastocatellia bacterium]